MPLLDRYLVQIWEQSGGCAPRFVPFSEIRDLIYEEDDSDLSEIIEYVGDYSKPKGTDIATDLAKIWGDVYPKSEPDGTSIIERMDALDDTETGAVPVLMERADAVDQQLFETPGVADKLAAIELRKDESVEILANKNIVNPQINETPVRAYFDIALSAPATKAIRISAITPGVAANSYKYGMVAFADPNDVGILWSGSELFVKVLKDDDERIITTAYELARLAAATPDFVSNFIISFDDGTLITEDGDGAGVIAAAYNGMFANGAGAGHVLTSTGTQIDAAVNMYLSNKYDATAAPGATNDIDEGYVVGSKWFDTVSKEWYICTANTQDNATWANTTLEAGELGTAAVADIVNDLTTGGTTDALSAEQGKELKTTLNTEAGYIDALQAVAPEYTATFATATAASGTLTLTGNPTAGDNISIGTEINEVTYTFVSEPTAPYDVDLGASASDTIDNLIAAITYDAGAGTNEGTLYGTGTVAHTEVTAAAGESDTMTVTALVKGAAGNGIGTTDPDDQGTVMSFGATTLQGGVDGQVGATGKIIFTASTAYFCTDGAKCTISDSTGWKTAEFL